MMMMIGKGTDHQSGHHRLNLLMLRDKRDQARQTYCLACYPHCVYNVSWFDTTEFQELQLILKLNIYGLCPQRVYNLAKQFFLGFTISIWNNMSWSFRRFLEWSAIDSFTPNLCGAVHLKSAFVRFGCRVIDSCNLFMNSARSTLLY